VYISGFRFELVFNFRTV